MAQDASHRQFEDMMFQSFIMSPSGVSDWDYGFEEGSGQAGSQARAWALIGCSGWGGWVLRVEFFSSGGIDSAQLFEVCAYYDCYWGFRDEGLVQGCFCESLFFFFSS